MQPILPLAHSIKLVPCSLIVELEVFSILLEPLSITMFFARADAR